MYFFFNFMSYYGKLEHGFARLSKKRVFYDPFLTNRPMIFCNVFLIGFNFSSRIIISDLKITIDDVLRVKINI